MCRSHGTFSPFGVADRPFGGTGHRQPILRSCHPGFRSCRCLTQQFGHPNQVTGRGHQVPRQSSPVQPPIRVRRVTRDLRQPPETVVLQVARVLRLRNRQKLRRPSPTSPEPTCHRRGHGIANTYPDPDGDQRRLPWRPPWDFWNRNPAFGTNGTFGAKPRPIVGWGVGCE